MDISYQELRNRMANQYRRKILEDGWGRHRIADDASAKYGFGVSRKQARKVINRVREEADAPPEVGDVVEVHTPESDVDYENGEASTVSARPMTMDEAIEHLGINEEDWRIIRPKVGTYEGQCKVDVVTGYDAEDEPITEQEHRVKTMYKFEFALERRHPAETEAFADKLLEQVADEAPIYRANIQQPKTGNLMRLHIPDLHVGKEGYQADWSPDSVRERVFRVLDEFVALAEQHGVDRISWPLGHDILQVDRTFEQGRAGGGGTLSTTSSGTPVTSAMPWIEQFLLGCDLAEQIARRLLEVAPLDINVVPGNHSEQSEIAIGRVMIAEFRNSPDVRVNLDSSRDKYYEWGVNGFMDTHGDTVSFKKLAMAFATSNGELWGKSKWREVNVGHKHVTKKRPVGIRSNETGGCCVYISPSLSPQDEWHAKYHYHGMPGAQAFMYHKERGPFANYERFF